MSQSAPTSAGRGTLSRDLVLRTTALVALATIALSVFTILASYQILLSELDERVAVAVRGIRQPLNDGPADVGGSGAIRLTVNVADPTKGGKSVPEDVTLTSEAISVLLAVPITREATTMEVPGLGLYRVLARTQTTPLGATYFTVVALPFSHVSNPLRNQATMAGVLTLLAIGFSFVGARRTVERALRPLNRLAVTATQVATLPLASGAGQVPVRVASVDADPTNEVGKVGASFNLMLDHVEGALAARHRSELKIRRFVADASHELRNPLAAIRGYAELTRRSEDDLPPAAAHAVSRIESESKRMSVLVEDLLLLARLDSEPTLDIVATDITALVLDAVSDARAASTDHHWYLDLPEEPVVAPGDRNRLLQVVTNLLANARTHTPPGTRVTTSLRVAGEEVLIQVSDNGPGVPTEIRDTVFERFTRAEASRVRHQGASSTGLGLAIVAAVVAAHAGSVHLSSEPGATTFTVRLPRN